jgi:hypothetical protein
MGSERLETACVLSFVQKTSTGDLYHLFNMFRRLGRLKTYNGSEGATTESTNQITAKYTGAADFDNGSAQIELGLIKHGEQWQILSFRVNSRAFLEQR